MKKKILTLALLIFFSSPILASTWNVITNSNNAVYFFDADTVVKNGEITTLWMKIVQMDKPMINGAWASADRWQFNCSKRTLQILESVFYSRDANLRDSVRNPVQESTVIPDSMAEEVLKVACEASFPRDTSGSYYFKIKNNDVFQFTKDFTKAQKTLKDKAPK